MSFYNPIKKFICFILLYTIFTSNTSIFYVFANEVSETTSQQVIDEGSTDKQEDEQSDDFLQLTAKSAVLIDAKTGIVIYDKNKDIKSYPASTTKILTALLAIENTNPTDILTHSHNAVYNIGPGSSHIGMRENEQITMEQGLYGVLLASANEVCMAIAEHVSVTVENFVELMNSRAKEIGANNTHFANPHGFHDDDHYTTSYDMALIMKEAIKNADFVKYISTTSYKIPTTNIVNEERILNNSNKLILKTSPYYYEYCVGGKTGFTDEAGNTLVTYAKKDNMELICAVMQDEGTKVYEDTTKLFEYGFSNYEQKEIFEKETYKNKEQVVQIFKDKEIALGEVYLSASDDVVINLPKNVDVSKIEKVAEVDSPLVGPVNVGDKVGKLNFVYEDNVIYSVDLVSDNKVDIIDEAKLERKEKISNIYKITLKVIKYLLIGVVIFVVAFFVLSFIVRNIIKYRRRRRKMNRYRNSTRRLKPMKKSRKRKK